MSIHQLDFNGKDKVEKAIMRLQAYEPEEGYFLCFSGGKDSCVIKALADMAGVKYDAHYSVASVDPPELVRFIKDYHPDVIFDIPHDKNGKPVSMWSLIPTKSMPPTRIVRYCCQYLKEQNGHGNGRLKVTGVRWAESVNRRKNQSEVTIMDKKAKRFIEKELSDLDFRLTNKGGGASFRQFRQKQQDGRDVLQDAHNHNKPNHRLDRGRGLGVSQGIQHSILLSV